MALRELHKKKAKELNKIFRTVEEEKSSTPKKAVVVISPHPENYTPGSDENFKLSHNYKEESSVGDLNIPAQDGGQTVVTSSLAKSLVSRKSV